VQQAQGRDSGGGEGTWRRCIRLHAYRTERACFPAPVARPAGVPWLARRGKTTVKLLRVSYASAVLAHFPVSSYLFNLDVVAGN